MILNAGHKVENTDGLHPNSILTKHLVQIIRDNDGLPKGKDLARFVPPGNSRM